MTTTQLTYSCPTCSKRAQAIGEFKHDSKAFTILNCGHFTATEIVKPISNYESFHSLEGDKPYKFQVEGMEFVDNAKGRALIADEMGLGKTIQSLGWLFFHPEARPVLFIVKKKLLTQFFKQIYRWCDKSLSQVIQQGHALLPGVQYYIISMDLLRSYPMERFERIGIKTVVIDECQHFKNPESLRTQSLRLFLKNFDVPNVIALSGTPFKNRISEYFTILNILAPHYFQVKEEFIRQFISFYYDSAGKIRERGLKNEALFRSITDKFIIRRERQQVEDQIPYIGIQRNIEYVDLEEKYKEAYENSEAQFQELFNSIEGQKTSMQQNTELLAIIQRMRHIVGLSKIPDTVDFVTDFLLSTERKIAIAVEHQDVGKILVSQLNRWCAMGGFKPILAITGNMDDLDLNEVVTKWNTDAGYRILVASTRAAGEGLNLQELCNECVFLEKQWNAANEEQFEARFRRIGQKQRNVIATYMVAGGTIDEMLTEIVERKRSLVKSGMLSMDRTPFNESELIQQLGEKLNQKRQGKKWGLGGPKNGGILK